VVIILIGDQFANLVQSILVTVLGLTLLLLAANFFMYQNLINFLICLALEIPKFGLFLFPSIISANQNGKNKNYEIGARLFYLWITVSYCITFILLFIDIIK